MLIERDFLMTLTDIYRAFQIGPSQAHALHCRGILPKRPRGVITRDYVLALADWHEAVRGPLPDEAEELIKNWNNIP